MSLATSNIFDALSKSKTKSKAKSKDSEGTSGKKKKHSEPSKADRHAQIEAAIFNQPQPSTSNWADCEEDDEFTDDLAPLPDTWIQQSKADEGDDHEDEGVDSEEEQEHRARLVELGVASDNEEEEEEEHHVEEEAEPEAKPEPAPSAEQLAAQQEAAREAAHQLSKKEQKAKELAEMEAIFAELGIDGAAAAAASGDPSKAARKQKKKNKAAAGTNGVEGAPDANGAAKENLPETAGAGEAAGDAGEAENGPVETLDPAEAKRQLAKKKAAAKKASTSAAAAAAAAAEAKARAKKKGGVKDKKHYNQMPTR